MAKKKRILDDITVIDRALLQPIFGGDPTAPPNSPERLGHFHDDGGDLGHAPKIDLTNNTTGRLVLADQFAVSRSINAYPALIETPSSLPDDISSPSSPFSSSSILTTAIWYFGLPLDMDLNKSSYFSFGWQGDITTRDAYGNVSLDPSKLNQGQLQTQTTTFRITWQWYIPGSAIYPPAVIFDGYLPTNINMTNANPNALTRGRLSSLTVNSLPFRLVINDSSTGNPNYVNLTGLSQSTGAVMVGIQVDVMNSTFLNPAALFQSGHIRFYQGNFIYLTKTLGSSTTSFSVL